MEATATGTRQVMEEYFEAISGQPKTAALIDRFVADPALRDHILQTEAAFPNYRLERQDVVVEGDLVAVRGTVRARHEGVYLGVAPTGRQMAVDVMAFYRVADGRIAQFWMQIDARSLMEQLGV